MASSNKQDESMDADNYQIDDEEMEFMIRSMNAGGSVQSEYVEEGGNEEFDWGRMNEALGETQANDDIQSLLPSTSTGPLNDKACPLTDDMVDMTLNEEIEKEAEKNRIEKEKEQLKRKKELEVLEKSRRKRIKFQPPGLNIFLSNDPEQEPFRYFTYKNLCLIKDFGYIVKHKERGYKSDEELRDIFKDPVKFIMHLSPEATSNLIHDKDDFEKICDYLVFCLASVYEDGEEKYDICAFEHFEMFKKALFDLLRNYGFSSFKLRLKHIFPCLLNLGFNKKVLLNEEHYLKALDDRISNVKNWYEVKKKKVYKWSFPKFHNFFVERQNNPPGSPSTKLLQEGYKATHPKEEDRKLGQTSQHEKISIEIEDEPDDSIPPRCELLRLQQIEAVENFVELISDLIITFYDDPYVSWFLPSSSNPVDWIDTLTTFHIFGSVASDKNLVINANIRKSVMTMYNTLIDSFDHARWTGVEDKSKDDKLKEKQENDDDAEVPFGAQCDVAEVLLQVGMQVDLNEEMKTWTDEEMPRNSMGVTIDHHHNMVNRIRLLPPTFRGNQVKKIFAFMCLQQIVDPTNIDLTPTANISDAANTLTRNRHKFEALYEEHYIMINIIRLLDQIAGCEPLIDYVGKEKREGLEKVESILTEYEAKKLKRHNAEADPSRVKELLQQVNAKWKMMKLTSTETKRQPTIDKFLKRPQSNSSK